jgi:hypothetical protein
MRLSDLRPCENCGGPLGGSFVVLRSSQAMLNPKAARVVMGTTMILGGALRLAEAMAGGADEAVLVFGDKDRELLNEFLLCQDCGAGEVNVGRLASQAQARARRDGAEV